MSRVLTATAAALLVAACGAPQPPEPAKARAPQPPPTSAPTTSAKPFPGANELGVVPVLMYHRIVEPTASVYDRTPADFRAELEALAADGYVPITTAEYASGDIDIPGGTHPVVLTFDDGDPSQFALTPEGQPAEGTAVAILRSVAAAHEGFRPVASFYLNADPFGDPGGHRTVPWLVANGMEVGNHTLNHSNLRRSPAAEAIAAGDAAIRAAGGAPLTIALPFGARPPDPALALTDGSRYHYTAALLVGANPAKSPYAADFDPSAVPRIRSQGSTGQEAEFGSTAWLAKIKDTRYTSDGIAGRIAAPAGAAVAPSYKDRVAPS